MGREMNYRSPIRAVRESCLEEVTTEVRTDLWKKLAGKQVQRWKRALPIDSEWLEWRERGRVVRVRGRVVSACLEIKAVMACLDSGKRCKHHLGAMARL